MAQVETKEQEEARLEVEAYNKEVNDFNEDLMDIVSTINDDMKIRQLPENLKGNKVYGPNAARRMDFNSAAASGRKIAKQSQKLRKGKAQTSKGGFMGFSTPSYIKPEMATALGLKEGTKLWPQGGKPIFSSALITKFFTNKVMKEGLVYEDNLSVFTCNDVMKKLFTPFINDAYQADIIKWKTEQPTDKDGKLKPQPGLLDLDNLTYTGIQKLIRFYVEKRDKKANTGPNITEEIKQVLLTLDAQFNQLKETKTRVKDKIKTVKKREEDLVKAKTNLDAGIIGQDLFNTYVVSYQQAKHEKDVIFQQYVAQATQMGI